MGWGEGRMGVAVEGVTCGLGWGQGGCGGWRVQPVGWGGVRMGVGDGGCNLWGGVGAGWV